MNKKILLGIGAAALCALNVMAFSAVAKPEPQLPIEFEGCYQSMSSCGYSFANYEACVERKTNHKCTRNYYKCRECYHAVVLEPIEFEPIEGPRFPIKDEPIEPIDPVKPIIVVAPR